MSVYVLPPIPAALSREAPLLDIVADNGVKDLLRREADIAIRHARPDQPNLLTRRVRDEIMRFYACRTYLEKHYEPKADRLADHQIIRFVEAERMPGYFLPVGLNLTKSNFRLSSPSQLVASELAQRAGHHHHAR